MELKLSDEVAKKLGIKPETVDAVLAEVVPIVLADPSDEELADSAREPNSIAWDYGDYRRARKLVANRSRQLHRVGGCGSESGATASGQGSSTRRGSVEHCV